MKDFFNLYKIPLLIIISCIGLYISFGYDLDRADFTKLITIYAALFFLSYKTIQLLKWNFTALVIIGVVFRLLFIVAIPNLSQDFYRFIWDGRMLISGNNPFLSTPLQWLNPGDIPFEEGEQLIEGMGALNASHYTNYPPIHQLIFALSTLLGWGSILSNVILMRIFIILADIGVLVFGRKILEDLKLPQHRIFWYFLNPFIIIELTGNLHFEGVMLFFLITSLYLLYHGRWLWSAVLLGLSVSVKLLPLLFLPVLWQFISKDRSLNKLKISPFSLLKVVLYYLIVGITIAFTFSPFISLELIANFTQSVGLWFQKFEFNASIFYIVRWIGFKTEGYNILIYATPILSGIVFTAILALSFLRKNIKLKHLITAMLFAVTLYLFMATTVHPWYIATPLALCVFTRYKFPIVWSLMVFLSYSAYQTPSVQENHILITIQYLTVAGFIVWELFWKNKPQQVGAL